MIARDDLLTPPADVAALKAEMNWLADYFNDEAILSALSDEEVEAILAYEREVDEVVHGDR